MIIVTDEDRTDEGYHWDFKHLITTGVLELRTGDYNIFQDEERTIVTSPDPCDTEIILKMLRDL